MGDLTYYELKLEAEINIKGNDVLQHKNYISTYYNLNDDNKEDVINKVLNIIENIGVKNIAEIFFENYNEYLTDCINPYVDSNNEITIDNIKEFLTENLDETDFDHIVIESNVLKNADENLIDKLKELDVKFNIINKKAVITFTELYESIYCENDNSSKSEIDVNLLNILLFNFGDKLKLFLKGDGNGTNC